MSQSNMDSSIDSMTVTSREMVESVEISDPKAKIITEELSNPLGKKIIQLLSLEELTTVQISKVLNASIQSVSYHIKRLVKAKIVKIDLLEIGPKGKYMKRYKLDKLSFLLVIDLPIHEREMYLRVLQKITSGNFLGRSIGSFLVFFSSNWLASILIVLLATRRKVSKVNVQEPPFVI